MCGDRANDLPRGVTWVATPRERDDLARRLRSVPRLAIDTEANGFHAYRPRLCLLQIGWEESDTAASSLPVALVDPLALGDELGELEALLEDPSREVVLHGADYDVRLLGRDAGVTLRGIFDTQVAARLAGREKSSLSHLAAELAGMTLSKAARKTDWAARPLPAAALRYAADDVRALFAVRDALGRELAGLGRTAWLEEECRLLERLDPAAEPDEGGVEAQLSRMPGEGRLGPRQRAVLLELLRFRDAEARRRDRPPGFVLPSRGLVEAAQTDARTRAGLKAAGIPAPLVARYGGGLLRAAAVGRDAPPRPREPRGPAPDAAELAALRRVVGRLRRARDRSAAEVGLDPGLIGPTAVLRAIARARPADADGLREAGLRRWQCELLGEPLLEALRGGA